MFRRLTRWILTRRSAQRFIRWRLDKLFSNTKRQIYSYGSSENGPCFYSIRLIIFRGWSIQIHAFHNPDLDAEFHSHPAEALRLILSGGYREQYIEGKPVGPIRVVLRDMYEGQYGWVRPEFIHRLDAIHTPIHQSVDFNPHVRLPTYTLWVRKPITEEINMYWLNDGVLHRA